MYVIHKEKHEAANKNADAIKSEKKTILSNRTCKVILLILVAVVALAILTFLALKLIYIHKTILIKTVNTSSDETTKTPTPDTKQKEQDKVGQWGKNIHPKTRQMKAVQDYRPWENIRLPKNIKPITYNISLSVNMKNEVYNGTEEIKVKVSEATNFILFHQTGLVMKKVEVRDINGINRKIAYKKSESRYEYYVIKMVAPLQVGKYILRISFNGTLRTDLNGFFINKNKKLAATFFSPINARTAFPCFDEPSFKAVFYLSITAEKDYSALSNMEATSVTTYNQLKTTHFKPTLVMSTYIFAWAIHNNEYREKEIITKKSGLRLRTWAFPEHYNKLSVAMNLTVKLLEFYENFFSISFPLKRIDVLVQPEFIPGAMENWGLISFRYNRYMLEKSKFSEYQSGYSLIAHEITHQWFGNYATMEFWDEAWLKEGFASYIGIYGGDKVDQTAGLTDTILDNYMFPALNLDSFSTSHSLSHQLTTNSEIREMFDTITYNKGLCIVHMLQIFLGEQDFRIGLKAFLNKYAYKNSNQEGLWEAIREATGQNVKDFMTMWTKEKGFPLVQVNRLNNTHVRVQQDLFSLDSSPQVQRSQNVWQVLLPYRLFGSKNQIGKHLLTKKVSVFKMPRNVLINPDHFLYYRVQYGPQMMKEITAALLNDIQLFTVNDRKGFVSDQLNIMAAKKASLAQTMNFLDYFKNENKPDPWMVAINHFMMIYDILDNASNAKKQWKEIIKSKYVIPAYKKLKIGKEFACILGDKNILNEAKKEVNKPGINYANVITSTCCAIGADTSNTLWDKVNETFHKSTENKYKFLKILGCTKDPKRLESVLNYTMMESYISIDNTPYIVTDISNANSVAHYAAWNFIKQWWKHLANRYADDIFLLKHLINGVVSRFSTTDRLRDVKEFFKGRNLGTSAREVKLAISQIEMKISYKGYMEKEILSLKRT